MSTRLDQIMPDPLDCELKAVLVAAKRILEHDCYYLNYTRRYRAQRFHGRGARATHR